MPLLLIKQWTCDECGEVISWSTHEGQVFQDGPPTGWTRVEEGRFLVRYFCHKHKLEWKVTKTLEVQPNG